MGQKLKSILFITNIPAPYRIDFYNELGKKCNLTVIFEAKRASGITFNWKEDTISRFKAIFLKEGEIQEKKIDWSILQYIRTLEYDAIFITNYSYLTEMIALLSIKLRNILYYYEVDGAMVKKDEGIFRKTFKSFFIKGAQAYISPSQVTDEYIRFYGGKNVRIHRYPFSSLFKNDIIKNQLSEQDKVEIRKKLFIKESHVVLAVGQFIYRKGFDLLLKAAYTMDKSIGIYIVGGKPTAEYIQMQKKYNLTQVHFVGFKTKEELAEYFNAADLFVHPTREDIWGLVINEAMAHGLPIVTTNKCVAGMELIANRECLIDTDNVEQLRLILEKLINNSELRMSLAKQNLQTIANYTIEAMVEAHLKIIG